MRNYFKSLRVNKGFTLIELLVVIGILGVLAAALIATIDPFEQIKKANDTNSKNTTVEFVTANIRYYTTHSALPWASGQAASIAGCTSTGADLVSAGPSSCIKGLIDDGESKTAFSNASTVLKTIRYTGTDTSVIACFQPTSKSQQKDPNDIYNSSGALTTGCAGLGGVNTGTSCYWCSQ